MPSRRQTDDSTKNKKLCANSKSTVTISHTRNTRGKSSRRIKKSEKPPRRSPRLQERLLNTLSSLDPHQRLPNKYDDQADNRQRKRGYECGKKTSLPHKNCKKGRPAKRARTNSSSISDRSQPLTEKNLKRHTVLEGYLDILDLINSEVDRKCKSSGSEASIC